MDAWVQEAHPDDASPFVVDVGGAVVNLHYPVGILRIHTLAHSPETQIIFVAEL